MSPIDLIFAALVGLPIYSWVLYPCIVISAAALSRFSRHRRPTYLQHSSGKANTDELMSVSVILPVYQGAHRIAQKLDELLRIDYPRDKLEIIVVSDGSTDATLAIAQSYESEGVRVFANDENRGKSAAQNFAIAKAKGQLVLFTDVEAALPVHSLLKLGAAFRDRSVGCATGRVHMGNAAWDSSKAQGAYWRIEDRVRAAESELRILASASGCVMLLRKDALKMLDDDTGDDFIIPLDLALIGLRTVAVQDVVAEDRWPSRGLMSELRVRRRITCRNLLGVARRFRLLNVFSFGLISWALLSHKVLRWFTPIFLAAALLLAALFHESSALLSGALYILVAAAICAAIGLGCTVINKRLPVLSALGAFVWANLGVALGIISFAAGLRVRGYRN